MISPKYIILLVLGCMALVWACRPKVTPDMEAANITQAFNNNNIDEACSLADKFFSANSRLDNVSVPQLCMLSITMIKMSIKSTHADDYAAQAISCYDTAIRRDSITATTFYNALNSDDFQYFNLLQRLDGSADVRSVGIYPDEEDFSDKH